MAEAGTKIEGEGDSSSQNPNLQADKYEVAARKSGWKPEEDWDGAAEDWVPAKEFVGRQKLFDKIHDLRGQISQQAKRFETDMAQVQAHFSKVQEVEYARAKRELSADLAKAKQDGDVEAVADIAGQIRDTEASAAAAKQQVKQARSGGPTPEFVEWQKDNEWFGKDAEITADAVAFGTGYATANPNKSQAEVLAETTKKMKRMYPEKFKVGGQDDDEERGGKQVNRVEGGNNRRVEGKKKGQLSVSDLDDVERKVMATLIKRGALKEIAAKNKRTQQEEYLAQLAERKGV